MSQKRTHTESTSSDSTIFTSTSIHDRASTFQAIFSPSVADSASLQLHQPFATASHKILAWRKRSTQKSIGMSFASSRITFNDQVTGEAQAQRKPAARERVIFVTGSDDDGEKYAGKKLEKVLTDLDVEGTLVVARWYGGVLLGPVRFKWIEDCAKEAVKSFKEASDPAESEGKRARTGSGVDGQGNAVKLTEDQEKQEKARLARILEERDGSVQVLRGLLAEKHAQLNQVTESVGSSQISQKASGESSSAKPSYVYMPLSALQRLEKARDATLQWILKQIDEAEAKTKVLTEKQVASDRQITASTDAAKEPENSSTL